ncbi:MAG: hypothetical protein M1834_009365 [Cirrosporium novae-zelandiae]|nr:MAG: hypothetical protein M1834_009365 [Cirrosporium novae-zelandiae]
MAFSFALTLSLLYAASAAAAPTNYTALESCAASMDSTLPTPLPSDFHFSGNIRRYYIAAEEVLWNYVPSGWDNWLGVPLNSSARAYFAGYTAPGSLGTKWEKALYRGYTDATFTTLSPQPAWQGAQGPTLRAEVGDMIEILFVNSLSQNYASMHSMGLAYSKDNEGSIYPNISGPGAIQHPAPGDAVAPGNCVVYKWLVNEGSAPTNGNIVHMWGYHSYISLFEDMHAGLAGPTIVYAPGTMNATIASYREFTLLYNRYDESLSFMSLINAELLSPNSPPSPMSSIPLPSPLPGQPGYGNFSIWHPQLVNIESSGQLSPIQAPTFSALNGLVYANNALFEMCVDDKVIWYVYAHGMNSHVFHMHGNGFAINGLNKATLSTYNFTLRPYFPLNP